MYRPAALVLLLALGAAACEGSPQPIPPPAVSRLSLEQVDEGPVLTGAAGAIDGRAEAVLIANFAYQSGALEIGAISASPDGSFAHTLVGALPTDELRLQSIVPGTFERSVPIDVSAEAEGSLAPLPDAGCLTLDRADLELAARAGEEARGTVEAHNGCGRDLDMNEATSRFPDPVWTVEGADDDPFVLADGERRTYTVVFRPAAEGPAYGAFVAKAADPPEVHAVTLLGRGLP